MQMRLMILFILYLLVFPVFADDMPAITSDSDPVVPQNSAAPQTSFTDQEKNYLIQAYRYMAIEQGRGLMVADAMSKLKTGEATLENLADIIKLAQSQISAAHAEYAKTVVPPKYSYLDSQINITYTTFDSAYTELLKFWSDSNMVHVDSGAALIQKAAVQQRYVLLEITNIIPKDQMQY